MSLANLLRKKRPAPEALPGFIRAVEDVEGIRVLRLQGSVGKEIGGEVAARNASVEREGVFERSVLLDFAGTTGADFSTISFLVDALRRRMATSARVGIVHAPEKLLSELEIAHIEGMFLIFDSEEAAMSALRAADRSAGGAT